MIGLESYDNPTKETWRGWWWNKLAGLLACGVGGGHIDSWKSKSRQMQKRRILADKTALYLCGPSDIDREVALRHGFSEHNLIAVDVKSENIVSVRSGGGIGISCSLQELLVNWPSGWRIDAVSADLCCGLGDMSRGLAYALWKCQGIRDHETTCPVVGINLQRGRDGETNELRQNIDVIRQMKSGILSQMFRFHGDNTFNADGSFKVSDKNRAAIWLDWMHTEYINHCFGMATLAHPERDELEINTMSTLLGNIGAVGPNVYFSADAMSRLALSAQFYSYHSKPANRIVMDSAIFNFPPRLLKIPGVPKNEDWEQCIDFMLNDKAYYFSKERSDIRAKLAALRAVRTMKSRTA